MWNLPSDPVRAARTGLCGRNGPVVNCEEALSRQFFIVAQRAGIVSLVLSHNKTSMPTSLIDLPIATIEKVLELRKKIEVLKASVSEILGGGGGGKVSQPSEVVKEDGRKGKRSAAARAKMAAAQKARWAKQKAS